MCPEGSSCDSLTLIKGCISGSYITHTATGLKYCTQVNENVLTIDGNGLPTACMPDYTLTVSNTCVMTDLANPSDRCMEGCNRCTTTSYDIPTGLIPLTFQCDSCLPKRYIINASNVCISCRFDY